MMYNYYVSKSKIQRHGVSIKMFLHIQSAMNTQIPKQYDEYNNAVNLIPKFLIIQCAQCEIRNMRNIINDYTNLRVDCVLVLLRPDPPGHQAVPDRVRQRIIVIPDGGHVPVLDQRKVQVSVERFLHSHHILDIRNGLDTDLFPLFHLRLVHVHRRHFDVFFNTIYTLGR